MSIKKVALKMIEEMEKVEDYYELFQNDDFIKDVRALPKDEFNEIAVEGYKKLYDMMGVAPF